MACKTGKYANVSGRAGTGCSEATEVATEVTVGGYFFVGWEFSCNFVEANGDREQATRPCRMISPALMSVSVLHINVLK